MNKLPHILCMVFLLTLTTSCIREDLTDCPPTEYIVKVTVKEKNYLNITQFPILTPKDETQPMNYYLTNLSYSLAEVTTGNVVRQSSAFTSGLDVSSYSLIFENLPEGEYLLTVWGNLSPDASVGSLHQDGKEQTDLYAGATHLSVSNKNGESTVELTRTKGNVVLFCKNFPANITRVHQNVKGVYQTADAFLNYSGSTSVDKNAPVQAINMFFVAPTLLGNTSKLKLDFYANNTSNPILSAPEIDLKVRRNEVSAVTIDYNMQSSEFDILIYIDGKWSLIHRLII